jgi:putative flippase GtrA
MRSKILDRSVAPPRLAALFRRFTQYSAVGVGTFAVDLLLIYLFKTYAGLADAPAVALGFLLAITLNFFCSYYWVYRGTERSRIMGYLIFVTLATLGLGVVLGGTLLLVQWLAINVYLARSLVSGVVGLINFFINTFFNFKMIEP